MDCIITGLTHSFTRLVLPLLLGMVCAGAQDHPSQDETRMDAFRFIEGEDWTTGSDIAVGGIFFPNFHYSMALGASSGDPGELAVGHHDANREGLTVQNIEFGTSLRASDYLEGFITYAAVIDQDDKWLGSLEEVFGKIKNLPGGFELRGGRYYNRFGFYNGVHPHSYLFVNRDLLEARILGEDAVTTEGAELAWLLPGNSQWLGAVSLSYGRVFLEEEEEEDGAEPLFSPEGGFFSEEIFSADVRVTYRHNDFHQWTGIGSLMTGDNFFGRNTQAYALGVEYLWRQNGLEPGGRFFRWRTEMMYRDINATSNAEPGTPASHRSLNEAGISTAALYGFNDKLQTGVNLAYIEGIGVADLNERFRASPLVQWNFAQNASLRLQYDYDHASDFGSEHSVWMQFNYSWGGHEVR